MQAVTPGTIDYGVREYPDLYELNATNAIAVYVEVDFHDNKSIAKWLIENAKMVGESIAKGVCKAYGVKYVADNNTPQKSIKYTACKSELLNLNLMLRLTQTNLKIRLC